MIERIPDLTFTFDEDGMLLLEQNDSGNVDQIAVHPSQLRLLCERSGLAGEFSNAAGVPNVQRRLQRIAEDAADLHGLLASVPSFPPHAEEDEDVRAARRLVEDIELLLADLNDGGESHNSNDKSPAISVTPADAPKRGRPPTGEAMSNAERQARYRERQGQQEIPLSTNPEKEQ